MHLTRAGDYALQGMVYLAEQPPEKIVLISDIARHQEIPESFLRKILQVLVRAGLVRSLRGVSGGVMLAKPARQISALEVVEAVEGPLALNACLNGGDGCDKIDTCPSYPMWREAQARLVEVLQGWSLADLARKERRTARSVAA